MCIHVSGCAKNRAREEKEVNPIRALSLDCRISYYRFSFRHFTQVWLTDDMANALTKCDRFGKRLMMIGPDGTVATDPKEIAEMVRTWNILTCTRF